MRSQKKAFIQVDNPHNPQWTEANQLKYAYLPKPHWANTCSATYYNTYQSKKVLGELFDMFDKARENNFNSSNIEAEMNVHIRELIEKASRRDCKKVEMIRVDMLGHLSSANRTMGNRIKRAEHEGWAEREDKTETCLKQKLFTGLYKQHRVEIENSYDDELSLVFAILYKQTYFESRDHMFRWDGKPYVFAWEVGHDYLTRIIADGEAKKNGVGIAPTVARGNDRLIFGKRR